MKTTYYFKELKSGNFEIATKETATREVTDLRGFFQYVSGRKSNVFDRLTMTFKPCRIIKSRYSQSQTYFQDALELEKYLSK